MCDNPFIVHEFFCAREKGTRRSSEREQTRFNCCRRAQTAPRSRRGILRIVVTIMQQFDCNPQFGLRNYPRERAGQRLFFFKLGDLMREPRYFAPRRIAMHDAFLRRADQSRLGLGHRRGRTGAITGGDRLLDLADRGPHARAPGFIDDGSARGLAGGLLCGFRIRHTCWTQNIDRERRL